MVQPRAKTAGIAESHHHRDFSTSTGTKVLTRVFITLRFVVRLLFACIVSYTKEQYGKQCCAGVDFKVFRSAGGDILPAELNYVPPERENGIPLMYFVPIAPEFTIVPGVFRWVAGAGTLPEQANAMAMVIQND
jgi:hypothetical protein